MARKTARLAIPYGTAPGRRSSFAKHRPNSLEREPHHDGEIMLVGTEKSRGARIRNDSLPPTGSRGLTAKNRTRLRRAHESRFRFAAQKPRRLVEVDSPPTRGRLGGVIHVPKLPNVDVEHPSPIHSRSLPHPLRDPTCSREQVRGETEAL